MTILVTNIIVINKKSTKFKNCVQVSLWKHSKSQSTLNLLVVMLFLPLLISFSSISFTNGQLATVCVPKVKGWDATKIPCCGWPKEINSRVTVSKSPGPAGAPSPCTIATGVCVNPCSLAPSPMIYEPNVRLVMAFLRRFRWDVYCPRYNWFFNPEHRFGENACQAFKLLNCGIDVTVFSPDSVIPICTTTKNYAELNAFQMMNANNCTSIQPENYLLTGRRVAYGMNLVSGCGQLRTVVLSKARDEFPIGYSYALVRNPLRKECITNGNVKNDLNSKIDNSDFNSN